MLLGALVATAGATVTGSRLGEQMRLPSSQSKTVAENEKPVAFKSTVKPEPLKMTQSTSCIILDEDFSLVPAGEKGDQGQLTTLLAFRGYEPGQYIDTSLTPNSGTWEGHLAYASAEGGSVVLQSSAAADGELYTPYGDYSGHLTITVLVRAADTFWAKGGGEYYHLYSSGIQLYFDGITVDDMPYPYSTRLYPEDGWKEITINVFNPNADPHCRLAIRSSDALEVGAVRVTDDDTYLAAPTGLRASHFTRDGFTIDWNRTRHTPFYYIYLWKKKYTADEGLDKNYDFDNGQLPEGAQCDSCQFVDVNSGKGVALPDSVWFETEDYGQKVACAEMQVMWKQKNAAAGQIVIEAFGDKGWERIWAYYTSQLEPGAFYVADLEEDNISGKYSKFRVRSEGIGKRNQLIIDNVRVQGSRPYELERVWGKRGDQSNREDGYDYYDTAEDMGQETYTFSGLDPYQDYVVKVRGMRLTKFSDPCTIDADGVALPDLLEPIVDRDGSFTMKWVDAPKADSYVLDCFRAQVVPEYTEEFPLVSEAFGPCSGSDELHSLTPLDNAGYATLDDYTDNPGWQGYKTLVGENMLGSEGGALMTPPMMNNAGRAYPKAYVQAVGTPGDYLVVQLPASGINGYIPIRDDGMASVVLTFDNFVAGDCIKFSSYDNGRFALTGFDLVQDLEEGDIALTWDSRQEVAAGVQQCAFSGLDQDCSYACYIRSIWQHERKTLYSELSPLMFIDIVNGQGYIVQATNQSGIELNAACGSDLHEVARYTIDGRPASPVQKGVVIVKMSDGSARKLLVK